MDDATALTPARARLTKQSGSLGDLVNARKAAQEVLLLLDVSGSMDIPLSQPQRADATLSNPWGVRRIDALRGVVAQLPPELPLAAFPGLDGEAGVQRLASWRQLPEPGGGTPLAEALARVRVQGVRHVILVSDGEPDSAEDAMAEGQKLKALGGKIDTFYVGEPNGPGARFLEQLAKATGGQYQGVSLGQPTRLIAGIQKLLTAGPIKNAGI